MAPLIEKTEVSPRAVMHDRLVDAGRHVAHLSHEAQLLKSVAGDAIEDGVHSARRAMKAARRRIHQLGDFRDDAAYRVKRQPLAAVGIAAGTGLIVGLVSGWIVGHFTRRTETP